MGQFRFQLPSYWDFIPRHARTIHVIGLDGMPQHCSVKHENDLLTIGRNQNESGRTYIAYPFEHFGELTICTGTLRESEQPYSLAVELARGTVNRLRNQTSIWQEGGLDITPRITQLTRQATGLLGRAVLASSTVAEEFARQSIETSMEAIYAVAEQFGKQISAFRVSQQSIPQFWMAASRNHTKPIDNSFEQLFDYWVDDGKDDGGPTGGNRIVGPWLDASPRSRFSTEFADFESVRRYLLQQCDRFLAANDQPALVHVACGINGIGQKNLSCRHQLQLTLELLERIQRGSCNPQTMVSFDYPWAERLAWSVGGHHPLQIADDLLRNGGQVNLFGLDINLDYWPNGSCARDPLQWIELVDLWNQLGLPLVICLRVPCRADRLGQQPGELADVADLLTNPHDSATIHLESVGDLPTEEPPPRSDANSVRDNLSDTQRIKLLRTVLPMLVARPGVHGIIWRTWVDHPHSRYPHSGLITPLGRTKRTLELLREFDEQTKNNSTNSNTL